MIQIRGASFHFPFVLVDDDGWQSGGPEVLTISLFEFVRAEVQKTDTYCDRPSIID